MNSLKSPRATSCFELARMTVVVFAFAWLSDGAFAQQAVPVVPANDSPHAPSVVMQGPVPVVQIRPPSAAGVSHNEYAAFNVAKDGVVLNNTAQNGLVTRTAGALPGNPDFTPTMAARLIVNEVTSTQKSNLFGPLEVNGVEAEVVVANPNGIFCAGCSFVNIPRVVLTTGKPAFDGEDSLGSFRVTRGDLVVHDLRSGDKLDRLDLWAHRIIVGGAVQVERGEIFAVAGDNEVRDDPARPAPFVERISAKDPEGSPSGPPSLEWGIDVGYLGGLFAGRIQLVATGEHLGVRNLGRLYVDRKNANREIERRIEIDAIGRVENAGRMESWHYIEIKSDSLYNQGTGVIDASDITIHGRRLVANEGHINAANVVLAGDEVTNYVAKVAKWEHHRDRDSEWRAQYDANKTGHIDASNRLSISAQRITNGPDAQVHGGGDLRIYGNAGRWTSQYSPPSARVFSNRGVVKARRDLEISADAIQNWNEGVKIGRGPRRTEHVAEYVTSDARERYPQADVRQITVDGTPMLETPDGKRIADYYRYEVKRDWDDTQVTENRPGKLEAGEELRLRGNVIDDQGEIVAGTIFRHQRLKPDQTVTVIDVEGARVRTDNGVMVATRLGPCPGGAGQCRFDDPPIKVNDFAQTEHHPMHVGFIREAGRDLNAYERRRRSTDTELGPRLGPAAINEYHVIQHEEIVREPFKQDPGMPRERPDSPSVQPADQPGHGGGPTVTPKPGPAGGDGPTVFPKPGPAGGDGPTVFPKPGPAGGDGPTVLPKPGPAGGDGPTVFPKPGPADGEGPATLPDPAPLHGTDPSASPKQGPERDAEPVVKPGAEPLQPDRQAEQKNPSGNTSAPSDGNSLVTDNAQSSPGNAGASPSNNDAGTDTKAEKVTSAPHNTPASTGDIADQAGGAEASGERGREADSDSTAGDAASRASSPDRPTPGDPTQRVRRASVERRRIAAQFAPCKPLVDGRAGNGAPEAVRSQERVCPGEALEDGPSVLSNRVPDSYISSPTPIRAAIPRSR